MSNVHRGMATGEVGERPANIIAVFWDEAERQQQESDKDDIAAGLLVIKKGSKEAETKNLYQKILNKHEKGFSVPKRKRNIIQDSDDDDDHHNVQDSDGELDYEIKNYRNWKRIPRHYKHLGLWSSEDFEVLK